MNQAEFQRISRHAKTTCIGLVAAVTFSLGMAMSPAQAGVISSTNMNIISPVPSVAKNALVGTQAYLFAEQTNFTTTSNITLDVTAPGTYAADPGNTVFAAGQAIDSYYLHYDLVITSAQSSTGSVTFDTAILGVIGNVGNLANTHAQLGAAGTSYWTSGAQGIWDSPDSITISGNTLSYDLSIGSAIDSLRIITAASSTATQVPAPAGAALLGLGLVGLCATRRRLKR